MFGLAPPPITLFFRTILWIIRCSQTSGNSEVWVDSSGTHGNYWSDYSAKYPNATEVGTSGVENATYIIDSNNQDNNPLIAQTSAENAVPELLSWLLPLLMIAATVPTNNLKTEK